MLRKLFKLYKNTFDKKIQNPTVVVLIISTLILLSGFLTPKNTLLLAQNSASKIESNIIILNGEQYEIILNKVN